MTHIHRVAVLGAGTMGAQIAAHVANTGRPALLLDLDLTTARAGLERVRALKPDPFVTPETASLISLGAIDTDLSRLIECDWIIEAVTERLDVKQELLAKVEPNRAPHAIVSSNTSGIPIATIAEGRSEAFRKHWLGSHFFNPPRYLHLLEVTPTPDTEPDVVQAIARFGERVLGKGVVIAKDMPNFIGNRIGLFEVMRVLELLASKEYTVEEIDAMTGPAIGRPKSATFRTIDIAGLDVLSQVTRNLVDRIERESDRANFVLPPLVEEMIKRGWVGEKAGQGFYRKERRATGSEILTLDLASMAYRARQTPHLATISTAQAIEDVGVRIRNLFLSKDRVGKFLRATLGQTLLYTAETAPEIAHSIDDVDRALRWGFGWELGPFELWDAIGVEAVLQTCGVREPPKLVKNLYTAAPKGVSGKKTVLHFRKGLVPPAGPDLQLLRRAKEQQAVVKKNAGASLIDLGDGVLAVEFHSKMNAIGGDAVEMLTLGVAEASRNFETLVVGNDSSNFSAGANLMLILLEAQEENWDEIDLMIRSFQSAVVGIRHADIPVVVAPAGLALGGGCEIALHADRVQAAVETYMGQVEVGVGLLPAGGGTKELLARHTDQMPTTVTDTQPYIQQVFELIGLGKVSTSAPDARRLGLLRDVDGFTMNRERLMADAKAKAIELARNEYQPPKRPDIPVGGEGIRAMLELGVHLAKRAGRISDYDAVIGCKLAHVLAGGDLPHPSRVSEQYVLDLEREAFLSLCGEAKTQARIAHTLKTGKPLKN